jgi:hypothetical protein
VACKMYPLAAGGSHLTSYLNIKPMEIIYNPQMLQLWSLRIHEAISPWPYLFNDHV